MGSSSSFPFSCVASSLFVDILVVSVYQQVNKRAGFGTTTFKYSREVDPPIDPLFAMICLTYNYRDAPAALFKRSTAGEGQ